MFSIDLKLLEGLVRAHGTPGEEGQVFEIVAGAFKKSRWNVSRLGRLAIAAVPAEWNPHAPSVLFCAHGDSPGFIVQSVSKDRLSARLVALGGPHCPCGKRPVPVIVHSLGKDVPAEICSYDEAGKFYECRASAQISRGDRVAFAPSFSATRPHVRATFLDNRLGCYALCHLAALLDRIGHDSVNVILAVTSNEEFLGFGASALAHAFSPDLAIVLDATYEEKEQDVIMGKGPVLTVSDKSVVLSMRQCQALHELCAYNSIRLQYEIYNFSGTDARAFPSAGLTCPVLPILVPTTGNHSPLETCRLSDLKHLLKLLHLFATTPSSIAAMA